MKKPKRVYCLFEQSGVFKQAFINEGITAYDYDIQNQFGQTDFPCDLYEIIDLAYYHHNTFLDTITPDDLILCFFPCTRFEQQIILQFRGEQYQDTHFDDLYKLERDISLQRELCVNYTRITQLVIYCKRRNLRLIFENPYSTQHYLIRYWCLKPTLIDYDRTLRGDYFTKPTAYWFINCDPSYNIIFEDVPVTDKRSIANTGHYNGIDRSLISPFYASRFVREFIL